jgi:hypothetical protein
MLYIFSAVGFVEFHRNFDYFDFKYLYDRKIRNKINDNEKKTIFLFLRCDSETSINFTMSTDFSFLLVFFLG